MQVASQCVQDASFQSADISTITPDTTALGHQPALGVSGITTDASYTHSIPAHPSPLLAGTQYSLEQPTLHAASLGTSAPPQPSSGPPGPFGAQAGTSAFLQQSLGTVGAQAGTVAPASMTSYLDSFGAQTGTSGLPQQSFGQFGAQAGTAAPASMTSYLAGVAPGFHSFAPTEGKPHFQVFQEDFENADMPHGGTVTNDLPRALAMGAKAMEVINTGDIYVQPMTETQRFKPVPVQRMRRAFGKESNLEVEERKQINVQRSALWNACAALDTDIAQLRTRDRLDLDILELLSGSLQWQVVAASAFSTCQAVLAGLSLVAGLVAYGVDSGKLQDILEALEPGFGFLKIFLAELTCAGNALRLFWTWEKVSAMKADGLDESSAGDNNSYHSLFQSAAIDAVRMLLNISFYICCLLNTRGNAILLLDDPRRRPVWSLSLRENVTNSSEYDDYDIVDVATNKSLWRLFNITLNGTELVEEPPEWPASFAHNLLWVQFFLGMFALALASGSGRLDLASPKLLEETQPADMMEDGHYSNK